MPNPAQQQLEGLTFDRTAFLPGATAATAANYGNFWIAPYKCVVEAVTARWSANSSSGTVTVHKVPSATAQDSGTALLSSTISTASGANTNSAGTVVTTAATVELAAGDALQLVDSGTLTSLTDLVVTCRLRWIP